jgi:hypothetical protein
VLILALPILDSVYSRPTSRFSWYLGLVLPLRVDIRWDLMFAEYGDRANDVLGTYLRILLIDIHSLVHSKILHLSLDGR